MSNFDRQVANALVKIHRELYGGKLSDCRWYYNAKSDIYHCPHTAISGKDLMARMPDWTDFNASNPTKVQWDNSPESEHTL